MLSALSDDFRAIGRKKNLKVLIKKGSFFIYFLFIWIFLSVGDRIKKQNKTQF